MPSKQAQKSLPESGTVEAMTHKTGKFIFSCSYDEKRVSLLQARVQMLYESLVDLPILPEVAAQLREDLVRRSIFGTAAIEGNALSEEEVGEVIKAASQEKYSAKASIEIANLKATYELLDQVAKTNEPFAVDEGFIKNVHALITTGIKYHHNIPGAFRNEVVKVGDKDHGGVYIPPKTLDDIKNLVGLFEEWINHEPVASLDPMLRAALAHYYLAKIHPFLDGNGRTARFIEAVILKSAGFKFLPEVMSNYYYKKIHEYFFAFSLTQRKDKYDVTDFLVFFLNGVEASLKDIKNFVVFSIRSLALRSFYRDLRASKTITRRQHDLLQILMKTMSSFTFHSLFSDALLRPLYGGVSESTARRDIKKLLDLGLLAQEEDAKRYRINMLFLG